MIIGMMLTTLSLSLSRALPLSLSRYLSLSLVHLSHRLSHTIITASSPVMHDKTTMNSMIHNARFHLDANKDAAIALFRNLEREGGDIGPKQFQQTLAYLGLEISSSDQVKLWDYLDDDNSGGISADEIVKGLRLNEIRKGNAAKKDMYVRLYESCLGGIGGVL